MWHQRRLQQCWLWAYNAQLSTFWQARKQSLYMGNVPEVTWCLWKVLATSHKLQKCGCFARFKAFPLLGLWCKDLNWWMWMLLQILPLGHLFYQAIHRHPANHEPFGLHNFVWPKNPHIAPLVLLPHEQKVGLSHGSKKVIFWIVNIQPWRWVFESKMCAVAKPAGKGSHSKVALTSSWPSPIEAPALALRGSCCKAALRVLCYSSKRLGKQNIMLCT